MTSPTKSQSHNARLEAQIAELQAQRDELMRSLLPLISTSVLNSSQSTSTTATPSTSTISIKVDSASTEAVEAIRTSNQLDEPTQQVILTHAQSAVKQHIALLHAYNGIRDVGQGLMGMIAEQRGLRVKQVMEEMGVGDAD
jgi:hypothetical protein